MDSSKDSTASFFEDNPEDIAKNLKEFSESAKLLSDSKANLLDNHELYWIGIYKGEVSVKSKKLSLLLEKLEKRNIPLEDTVIRFVEKNKRALIL